MTKTNYMLYPGLKINSLYIPNFYNDIPSIIEILINEYNIKNNTNINPKKIFNTLVLTNTIFPGIKEKYFTAIKNIIPSIIATEYNIDERLLYKNSREGYIPKCRQIAMFFFILCGISKTKSANHFGKDHATGIHAQKVVINNMLGKTHKNKPIDKHNYYIIHNISNKLKLPLPCQ